MYTGIIYAITWYYSLERVRARGRAETGRWSTHTSQGVMWPPPRNPQNGVGLWLAMHTGCAPSVLCTHVRHRWTRAALHSQFLLGGASFYARRTLFYSFKWQRGHGAAESFVCKPKLKECQKHLSLFLWGFRFIPNGRMFPGSEGRGGGSRRMPCDGFAAVAILFAKSSTSIHCGHCYILRSVCSTQWQRFRWWRPAGRFRCLRMFVLSRVQVAKSTTNRQPNRVDDAAR